MLNWARGNSAARRLASSLFALLMFWKRSPLYVVALAAIWFVGG